MIGLAPGGTVWLLRHELRLIWRRMRSRRGGAMAAAAAGAVVLMMQGLGIWLGIHLNGADLPEDVWISGLTALLAFLAVPMLSQSLGTAVEALYERQDLEWLLTSPIPFRRVLAVRMAGAALQVAGTFLLFVVGPVANGLAVGGRPEALAIYPVLLTLAVLATVLGSGITVLLVSTFGLKRARSVSNGVAMGIGAGAFLVGQTAALMPQGLRAALLRGIDAADPDSAMFLPGRAALGEPGPLLLIVGLGVCVAWGASRLLERRFATGVALVPARAVRAARVRRAVAFRTGRGVLLQKELRILRRTPGLLAQALYRMLYLVPAALPVLQGTADAGPLTVAAVVFATGEMARLLVSASISGDGAAELVQTAPVPAGVVLRAKLLAPGLVLGALLLLPLAAIGWSRPVLLPVGACAVLGVGLCAMQFAIWQPSLPRSRDLGGTRLRLSGSDWLNVAVSLVWAALAWGVARYVGR